jgi:hypothetical protein
MEKDELKNDSVIPVELKESLTKKVGMVVKNICLIEEKINNSIDDFVEESETPLTITEINSALLNVLKKMNQKEIMELVK